MSKRQLELQEFIRHYSETYVRIKRKKTAKDPKWEVAYFRSAEIENMEYVPVILHIKGKQVQENLLDIEVDTSFPKFGLYPHSAYGQCVLLVSRYPARQWRWGMCRNNTSVVNVFTKVPRFLSACRLLADRYGGQVLQNQLLLANLSFDETVAASVLEPEYQSYEKALEQVRDHEAAFSVIHQEWMVTVSPTSPGILLWRYDVPVAEVNLKGNQVRITEPLFYQEVLDFYSRQGITNVQIENR